jgi:hypothetical protein
MSEWQPIEKAPKDGTVILLYRDHAPWDVRGYGHWEDCGGGICGWVTNGFFDPPGNLGLAAPTHWMPLPEPPQLRRGT